ncbi:flagellin [Vibrio palustris]|uniref:Flagellin n=1 Tax=Vibrio palustris TaxID=1918946 RepID=A0A1R4B2U9_9VIBR|nr:flagellin [Vibrio palustris]SJL83239.1 Flagellin D [Vibrio palustris]
MAISIRTNYAAQHAQHQLSRTDNKANVTMMRLLTGQKINSAKDDASGLQIANRLQSQAAGIGVAVRNAHDGISIVQTAESGMQEYSEVLMRMRDLTLQYGNGANNQHDRESLGQEFESLRDTLNHITNTTRFAGQPLLNGLYEERSFQIGASSGEAVNVLIPDLSVVHKQHDGLTSREQYVYVKPDWRSKPGDSLSFRNQTDPNQPLQTVALSPGSSPEQLAAQINQQTNVQARIETTEEHSGKRLVYSSANDDVVLHNPLEGPSALNNALFTGVKGERAIDNTEEQTYALPELNNQHSVDEVLKAIDRIQEYVDSGRGRLGAVANRFSSAISNLSGAQANVARSHGQIRDTDYAHEASALTQYNIIKQADTSMLAQANQHPQQALRLLD